MNKDVELIASYWTLAGGAQPHTDHEYTIFDLKDRVEACAKVGFKGIGIWHADLVHTLKRRPLSEIKRILDDNGMKHIELEFLGDWFLTGEKKKKSDVVKQDLLEAASILGRGTSRWATSFIRTRPCRRSSGLSPLCARTPRRMARRSCTS